MSKKIKNSARTPQQEKSDKKVRQGKQVTIFAVILGIVIIVGILASIIVQSGVIVNRSSAVTIDGTKYKLSEFNYYYYANYNSYMNENSQFTGYMFEESQSLKDQEYDDKQSWFEYFQDQAIESMSSIIKTAAEANADGFKLSESGQAEIDEVMESIRSSAESAGRSADKYLENIYGTGMTEKLYETHLMNSHLAAEYSDKVKDGFQFSEEEIKAYYEEHIAEYTFVNYERFYVKASEVDTEPTKEEKQKASELAEKIYDRVEKGEELETVSKEFEEDGTYYRFDDAYYDASFSYGDWLFSSDRKDGDAAVIDDGSGYYVMVFHSRDESSYPTANIIDISFPVDIGSQDSEAEDYSDKVNQLYEDSCMEAEALLEKWESGEKTEESFKALAAEKTAASEDEAASGSTATSESDGTYQNLIRGTLDDAIDKWTFDSQRKQGDCQVLYTEGGFHVVYYAGTGTKAWKVEAEQDLRAEAYDTWYQKNLDSAKVKRHSYVLSFAGDEINK